MSTWYMQISGLYGGYFYVVYEKSQWFIYADTSLEGQVLFYANLKENLTGFFEANNVQYYTVWLVIIL